MTERSPCSPAPTPNRSAGNCSRSPRSCPASWPGPRSTAVTAAQRYYLQSYALAAESGITGHDGFVMRTMAMQGLRLHRPEHCQGLAETGLNRAKGKVDNQTEALFRVVHAHTLAKTGDRHAALAEAERARVLMAADRGDEPPFWALTWGPAPASVHSRTAKVYETLGDHQAAAEQYAHAAASRPADTYARIIALDLAASAEMHFRRGGVEQACATWMHALDHMDGVRSTRTHKALTRLRSDLTRFRARATRPNSTNEPETSSPAHNTQPESRITQCQSRPRALR